MHKLANLRSTAFGLTAYVLIVGSVFADSTSHLFEGLGGFLEHDTGMGVEQSTDSLTVTVRHVSVDAESTLVINPQHWQASDKAFSYTQSQQGVWVFNGIDLVWSVVRENDGWVTRDYTLDALPTDVPARFAEHLRETIQAAE